MYKFAYLQAEACFALRPRVNTLKLNKYCRCGLLPVLSERNKGSREGFAKTAGGYRLSVQTPGSRHRLHQVGHRQEQGHGLPAL